MSRSSRNTAGGTSRGAAPNRAGPLFAGILFGILLGLVIAAIVAWYILQKNPASFEDKERRETSEPAITNVTPAAPVAIKPITIPGPVISSAPAASSGVEAPAQHFEFYKVLTDRTEKPAVAPKEPKATATPKATAPATAAKEIFYVQAGSFPKASDAENLKAKLTLLGMEATIQSADIPNKGTYHRVRVGPFKGNDELNKALTALKQNGVANPTPIKMQ
ncbi:MAG: SPOR domain-containing protein [Gallionellaceae bacterium]|jgi:cell division protein FtsN